MSLFFPLGNSTVYLIVTRVFEFLSFCRHTEMDFLANVVSYCKDKSPSNVFPFLLKTLSSLWGADLNSWTRNSKQQDSIFSSLFDLHLRMISSSNHVHLFLTGFRKVVKRKFFFGRIVKRNFIGGKRSKISAFRHFIKRIDMLREEAIEAFYQTWRRHEYLATFRWLFVCRSTHLYKILKSKHLWSIASPLSFWVAHEIEGD